MHFVYVLASYALFLLLFPLLALHRKTRHGLGQRLGFYAKGLFPRGEGPTIWLHGASAGDLLALSPMLPLLRAAVPGCRIVLSTTTNTGYLMARQRLAEQIDTAIYAPYDLWGATRRAVRAIRPDLLVLEYTEIWPNLIAALSASGGRLALTNGRFSPSQLGKYRALFALTGNPLAKMDILLMRSEEEAERALSLGAPRERVLITGNTKFDALGAAAAHAEEDVTLRRSLCLSEGAFVLIAGSTHEGEEETLLEVYQRLLLQYPTTQLVIAPRYIDRAQRILALAKSRGFRAGLRSVSPMESNQVMVLDTIGELSRAYRLATLVFVGGSFTRRGGQNILEPAAQGKAVLFGPHMDNFRDSVQVLVGRGGIQVNDADHLYRVISELLSRPQNLQELGAMAQAAVRQVSGASGRNVAQLRGLLLPRLRAE